LRRVAIGIAKLADLPARDIERLKVLLLVEENGGGLRRRSRALSRAA